jgi:hypothetical protein
VGTFCPDAVWGMWHLLSMVGTGAVVLYVCFSALAQVSPAEAAGISAAMTLLGLMLAARALRLDYEIRSRSGDPDLRLARNRRRERRGF